MLGNVHPPLKRGRTERGILVTVLIKTIFLHRKNSFLVEKNSRRGYFMNHVFRILSILALLIFSLEVSAFAQETGFLTPGKSTFLYLNTKEMNVNYDNESLKFVMLQNGTLKLMSRDGRHDYMSFTGYDGTNAGIGYAVREIYTINPSMKFFEINANCGAHAKNCGYWVVGKRDGNWVCFVSIDSLAQMGYTSGEWHQIKTSFNEDATGRFLLTSQHEYMPPGAQFQYQRKFAVDLRLQLFWDQNARWFGIRKL